MKKILCLIILLSTLYHSNSWSQSNLRVMFYNVENLFDTKDNPHKNDDAFTPQGNQRWYNNRYWKKLHDISKVITTVGEGLPPTIVGLCEVENDSALFDLTRRASLNKHKYRYIVTDSRDDRGMNVALLYQRDEIKILSHKSYTPIYKGEEWKKTRDILHVSGKIANGDTLDIFVCHFHSRTEGLKKTKPYRRQAAQLLKNKTDSLFSIRKKANIIIMGDFNDYPKDESLAITLQAGSIKNATISKNKLYNMFYHKQGEKDSGSYRYKGKWNYLDQFIVSGSLLENNRTRIKDKKAHVFTADFLVDKDYKYGGVRPFRTYLGYKYLGGISDHLPIYMDLIARKK